MKKGKKSSNKSSDNVTQNKLHNLNIKEAKNDILEHDLKYLPSEEIQASEEQNQKETILENNKETQIEEKEKEEEEEEVHLVEEKQSNSHTPSKEKEKEKEEVSALKTEKKIEPHNIKEAEEVDPMDDFYKKSFNFILMSQDGKPIYTLNSQIYIISSFSASISAMIAKYTSFLQASSNSISKM